MPIRVEIRVHRDDPWRAVKRQALVMRLKNALNQIKNRGVASSADEIEAIRNEIEIFDGPPAIIIDKR